MLQLSLAVETGKYEESSRLLFKYTEMLLDHIAVEDEELFQMAETLFNESELEKLYFDFEDIDRELGPDRKKEYENLKETIDFMLSSK